MPDQQDRIEQLQSRVAECEREITRLVKERNEYLAVSAHQMKGPLATIVFSVNTLIGEYAGKLNTQQLRVISSIKRSALTLQNLVRDIIELEKLRSGDVELTEMGLVETAVSVIEERRDTIQERNIDFQVDLPDREPVIRGHPVGMKLVIENLLENAVKYSHPGGTVRFRMWYDEKNGRATVLVEDEGIGIPEKEQELVFREFYRSRNAKRFDPTGTGFGMAIVKQVVDFCGGELDLKSRENEGTRVSLFLPLEGVRDRETAELERGRRKRIVVVGGVSAGPKAASRARRLDPEADITIFDREFFLAYAGCVLPYYISGKIKTQQELAEAVSGFQGGARYFQNVRRITIKNLCEVTSIDRESKLVRYTDLMTDEEHTMSYDVLILATGSTPIVPETIGVNLLNIFVLHGVSDSEKIKSALAEEKARDIVIVGGGLIGVETAEALTVSGARITIVEKREQILPFLDTEMAALVERHLVHQGIRIIKNNSPSAFIGKKTVRSVQLSTFKLPADMVILAMGIRPNVGLAVQAGLHKGPTGALAVNEYLQTNDPAVYAAGDCTETWHAVLDKPFYLPMGSIANRMGRIAGGNATGKQHERFSPVTGTIIINVFDYHVAKTGLNEQEARKAGFDTVSSYVPEFDREPFVPGAGIINIKMTACRETSKLLGVQIVGKGEVAKRIDIAAMVIAKGGSVDDIHSVDLGYAPVYSSAVSAIAVAANVLRNKLDGLFEGITSHQALSLMENHQQDCIFLDVRTPPEYEDVKIPGFDLIPLEDLHRRADEILPDRTVILACESGLKSYQAFRMLKAKGFERVKVLEGGIRMWPYALSRG